MNDEWKSFPPDPDMEVGVGVGSCVIYSVIDDLVMERAVRHQCFGT